MNNIKWISIGVVGSIFAVSHLGMIGYIATRTKEAPLPSVDLPVGPYTSYKVSVSDEGYAISYSANDPKKAFITKDIKEKAINAALGGVGDSLPDMMDTQLPPVTGAPVPLPAMP